MKFSSLNPIMSSFRSTHVTKTFRATYSVCADDVTKLLAAMLEDLRNQNGD